MNYPTYLQNHSRFRAVLFEGISFPNISGFVDFCIKIVIAVDGMHSSVVLSLFCLFFFCEVAVGVGGSDTLLLTIEP